MRELRVRHRKALGLYLAVGMLLFGALAVPTAAEYDGPRILASTAWTGAIAEAAGAQHVDILAPFELRHPPERDFRPSDVTRTLTADVIVWAGYEGFVRQLIEAAEIPVERVFQIRTANTPSHLVALTRELAVRFGTEEQQSRWEEEFLAFTQDLERAAAEQNVAGTRVLVVEHLLPYVNWLGYNVVGTFGFEEVTPARIYAVQQLAPDMVIDVWHNPSAEPLALAAGAEYVLLLNFPGHDGTRSLIDVFAYNARRLGLLSE